MLDEGKFIAVLALGQNKEWSSDFVRVECLEGGLSFLIKIEYFLSAFI